MMRKRSEAPRRFLSLSLLFSPLLLGGCLSIDEALKGTDKYVITPQPLTASALEKRMQAIDAQYAEPRSPASVAHSLETAEASMSANNDFGALWRGLRACAWLAQNDPDYSDRAFYGLRGIAMGKKAITIKQLTTRPEPFYYLALCMGAYCELKGTCDPAFIREMREHASMARAIDETFDYCGADRFLGKLIIETANVPRYHMAPFEDGLKHLQTAAEKCPDFAENHLFLAEALIQDGEMEGARLAIEKVFESGTPPDHSAEHAAWLESAAELLSQVALDDEVSVKAAAASFELPGEKK